MGTHDSAPRSLDFGDCRITCISDGTFRLDGGAMWGVVPANLWRPMTPPAEDNTILLALNCFLVERGEHKILIEGGVGDRWADKHRAMFHIDRSRTLVDSLAQAGVAPADITHAVASHCHWDHIGAWVVEREGSLEPRFPNARHFAPQIEVDAVLHPDPVRKASYRSEDLQAVLDAGLLEGFVDGQEVAPGVTGHVLGGHSSGVSVLRVDGGDPDHQAVFWADVVPTSHHIQPPYIMAYDLNAELSYQVRSEWLQRAAEGSWLGLFYHDPEVPFARVRADGRRYALEVV